VTGGGGVVKTVEKMGRRKLAYMVRKFNDGNYVLLTIEANGAVVLELERRLRVTEPVIKFITVRIDEEEKRLAKVKALRGVRRTTTPAVSAANRCGARGSSRRRRKLPSRFRPALSKLDHESPLPALCGVKGCGPIQRPEALEQERAGAKESEEETACLMKIKETRRKRAHQHRRAQIRARIPARRRVPAPAGPGSDGPRTGGRPRWTGRTALRRTRRTRQVLPPQKGLQVLHREDRRDSLPRCAAAARICGRARQDRAPAAHRRLHQASAPPDPRHQAGPEYRPAAVCHAALGTVTL
jgi:ribosomal protein S6